MTEPMSAPEVVLTSEEVRAFWQAMCEWNDIDDRFSRHAASNVILHRAVERILAARLAAQAAEHEREVAIVKSEHNNEVARRCAAERALADLLGELAELANEHEAVMDARLPMMTDREERESGRRTVRRLRALLASEPQP